MPSGRTLGLIPSPMDWSYMKGQHPARRIKPFTGSQIATDSAQYSSTVTVTGSGTDGVIMSTDVPTDETYAASYDLRTYSKVSPVKDQGSCGACWTFSTMAALESRLLTGESFDFSENNLDDTVGFNAVPCMGGNRDKATAYLTRWSGPWTEAADPYTVTTNQQAPIYPSANAQKHIQEVIYLPDRASATDNDNIKWALTTYGAVATSIRMYEVAPYFNTSTKALYYNGTSATDHAVTIVGWDDNYSAANFTTVPPGNGAFLIKNSWGASWGNSGYFWVSYYDSKVANNTVYIGAESNSNYYRIYQYDPLGATGAYGYGAGVATWGANVFTSVDANTQVDAVGFYTMGVNTAYELYVYRDMPVAGNPRSGTLVDSQTGTYSWAGYHTLPLTTKVQLVNGQKFTVVLKLTTPGANSMAMEYPYADYSSSATASAGQSYYSNSGSAWNDLTGTYANSNNTIKAFTSMINDATPPADVATVNDGSGADISYTNVTTQLSANWSVSSDPESGIRRYWYAIGTTPGGTDVVGWTDNGVSNSVTRTALSLTNGQTYYFSVKAENWVGLQSAVTNSNGQMVETTAPAAPAAVRDGTGADIAWTGSLVQLSANWDAASDPQSGIGSYEYGIGTFSGGTNVVAWTTNGTNTSVTRTGLSLTAGQAYYFTVRAFNGAGMQSTVVVSNGQTVDSTPPSAPGSVNDGTGADVGYTNSVSQLSANWAAASDPQSGITKYWYGIGTAAGATDVVGWTDNGNNTSVTRTGLSLTDGQFYYFTVKTENGAGLQSGVVNSNGQMVDASPPSAPAAVSDGAGADLFYANSAAQLSANWSASADGQSGIAKYWYAIGTAAGGTDVAGWTDNGASLSVTKTGLSLTQGLTYYFTVKAENGAGLQSGAANSNGARVDATGPASPAPVNDGVGADMVYTASASQLSANWSASSDPDSGVMRYWYAVGTSAGASDVVGWTDNGTNLSVVKTDLSLSNGQPYYFAVKAENGSGLQTQSNSNGQTVDVTPPTTIASVNDGTGADISKTGADTQLSANWTASSDPQSGIARYWYAIGTTPGGTNVAGWTDNGPTASVLRGGLSLTNGVTYYFTVKAENGSGLQTAVANSNGQYVDVDYTPPANVPQVRDGLGADTAWNGSLTQLSANWDAASDPQSGISRYEYAVGSSPGGTDAAGWTDNGLSLSVTRTGLSLSNGQNYYVSVRAYNGSGLVSGVVSSNGQTVDSTPPSAPAGINDGTGVDQNFTASSSQLSANWTAAADAQSGVARYWYAIGTSAGATDVVGWTDNGSNLSVTRAGLALTDGTRYYFTVKAENGSGLQSGAISTDGQISDSSQPSAPVTVDDGGGADITYTTSLSQLTANWTASSDPHSGVVKYWYAIGTSPGGTNVAGWTDNGLSLSVTKAGLSLTSGQIYYFSVKAENGSGLQSGATSSNGQTADNTAPSSPASVSDGLAADIAWTNSLGTLEANWAAASDAQSGVARYWFAIGTTPGGTDVLGWTDNGANTSITRSGLALTDNTPYYFTVKAENGAGLQSAAVNSNGQRTDSTPPAPPAAVRDGSGADAVWAGSLTDLTANWDAASDAQSGITRYGYAIGTTPGGTDVQDWTDNGPATSVTATGLSLNNGQIYYFSVKAENGSGLQSGETSSNGQTTDSTPPTNPTPVNDGTGADIYYVSTNTYLSANWAASADPESGVARYRYKIGTMAGAGDVVDWTDNGLATSVTKTGLSLTGGQIYYFTVRAENGAGRASGAVSSNGQMVEISSPTPPSAVRDGTGTDVNYVNSLTQLSANWSAADDPETSVAKYYYAIGTSAGATNVAGWTDNGLSQSVTRTGLSLVNGQVYYFTVKAENGAGMQSPAVNSDGQRTDTTVPSTASVTVNDGIGADIDETGALNRLAANWTAAADPESGILRYWYGIGTSPGATDVVGWTNVGLSTYAVKTGLLLNNHQAYYFAVKADNGAGLQSLTASSDGQTTNKDTTPPTDVPAVRDGPAADISWAPSASQLTANWDPASDAESGIGAYYYAVGTVPGGTDVLNWTDNGLQTSATAYGLSLVNGQMYYMSVMCINGGGLYSAGVTSSNGQRVDATAPLAPARVDDGGGADIAYTSSLTQLSANWPAASDPESGVTAYLYAVGTSPGGYNTVPWTSNGLATAVTKTALVLANGQKYYFSVKALNAAGAESAVASSDGQTADNTAPSAPGFVYDGTGADVAFATCAYQLAANWGASADAQSGVAKYYYSIGTSPGAVNVLGWTDNGVSTGVTRSGLTLSDGITYYFNVKAVNGSGLESGVVSSDGQKMDMNPATDVSPVMDGAGADIDHVPSLTALSAHWNASVHSSGIAAYYYGIGTSPGGIDVLGWTNNGTATSVTRTGMSLVQGQTYYFTVKARTNQGTESAPSSSDGQRADTIAPTAAIELTPAPPLKSGSFTVKLTVTEAGVIASGPSLSYQPASGPARTLQLTAAGGGVWNASGFVDSLCSSGTAVFSFSASDGAGNAGTLITSGGSFGVDTSMPPATGGTASAPDGTVVTVPAGAAATALWVSISTPPAAETDAADARTYDSVPIRASSLIREFDARDPAGTQVTNFVKPVTVRITWPDANNDGRVDGDYIKETLLRLYYLNPAGGKWEPVEGARRNLVQNYIEADVPHFSVYGIRAIAAGDQSMSSIKARPNPCYMAEGPLVISGIPVDSSNPKVQIFNVAGELVRTLKPGEGIDTFNVASWDGRNASGAKAASGLYIYLVKSGNHGTATGKFAILW